MHVIFKKNLRCNINCKYCSMRGLKGCPDMPDEAAYDVLQRLPKSYVCFHGGEPMLAGKEFYERLPRDAHWYSMQTNLTLIDESWVPVIKERFRSALSTSFDPFGNFRPVSSKDWLEKVALLQGHGIRLFSIALLTKQNQGRAGDIYDFFAGANVGFRLNPVTREGGAAEDPGLAADPGGYADAVTEIFDRWFMSGNAVRFSPGSEIVESMILGGGPGQCPFTRQCSTSVISIFPDGSVYPCGRGGNTPEFRYGNIMAESLDEVLARRASHPWEDAIPEGCGSCRYYFLCRGGCKLLTHIAYGDTKKKSPFCGDYMRIFSHIEKRLTEYDRHEIASWLPGKGAAAVGKAFGVRYFVL